MSDLNHTRPLDYAAPDRPTTSAGRLVVAALCLCLGALLCGAGVPCMIGDNFNPENMPVDTGIIVVGAVLCAIGMHRKHRRPGPAR